MMVELDYLILIGIKIQAYFVNGDPFYSDKTAAFYFYFFILNILFLIFDIYFCYKAYKKVKYELISETSDTQRD